MARKITPLTDSKIRSSKPKEKDYVLSDGNGLQLKIRVGRSKAWNFNYYHPVTKKRINIGLGAYPDVSLAEAREAASQVRKLVANGIDPKELREQERAEQAAVTEHTFFNIASMWFEQKKPSITEDYATDIWRSFELHIFPQLQTVPVSQIAAPQVIGILRPLEAKGSLETVKRLSQRINEVMTYAVNHGLLQANPLIGIKEVFQKPQKKNTPAIKPNELPELLNRVLFANVRPRTKELIKFQLHTMTRPSEAAEAQWEEINFHDRVWLIPAERMKKRKEHRIPLTNQVLALLERMRMDSGNRKYIFPADRNPNKPMNEQTANAALKRMGMKGRTTAHGLRSLASTTLNEQGFNADLIEAALSHVDGNEIRRAYNRTDYLEQRRPMMQWWSEHIEAAMIGAVTLTGNRGLKVVENA
ncbi:integrase domain-containing protein [Vibrio aestuarianus]|uniref:Integrase domain-containing protein n=1 Tax=Vibrio aestuarianus TaxID=28171 RepID=A0ABD7YM12_9VIBR|nr:integrase domain-containing protein [Vibrio aestuarianus]WGK85891.1 integrase domain-containing protein [Vibrio aestuarianus]CAH8189854.1 Phage integrase [Vibrio aestuarianus]